MAFNIAFERHFCHSFCNPFIEQEFSLAREQREEEIEKERLQKAKESARELDRQARLEKRAKFKSHSRRRQLRGNISAVIDIPSTLKSGLHGEQGQVSSDAKQKAADQAGLAWEARRSPRYFSVPFKLKGVWVLLALSKYLRLM